MTEQASELVFGQCVGYGCDRAKNSGGVAAGDDGDGEGFARVGNAVVTKVECATSVGEPAHDEFVATKHLLAVDAGFCRALCGIW